MLAFYTLAFLLTINIFVVNFYKIQQLYYFLYKSLIKPKFLVGEFVFIDDVEYEVLHVSSSHKPYTYYCFPVNIKASRHLGRYVLEKEIKSKPKLLKVLE